MSADILSDKEISSLLKLAAAASDSPTCDEDANERGELVAQLDRVASALDVRRGLPEGEPN